jgi:uncharacterized protein
MKNVPRFPNFRPVELSDAAEIAPRLWKYQPEISELTFTNLFIWQEHYRINWCMEGEHLLIYCSSPDGICYALEPVGPPPRAELALRLLNWLRTDMQVESPHIERADARFCAELGGDPRFSTSPARQHFDYLYHTNDLIHLEGRNYHSKRNFINTFNQMYEYDYREIKPEYVKDCLDFQEVWCRFHRCEDDMGLMGEWSAIRRALEHLDELHLKGGIILVDDEVQAFTLGEKLNEETAVVHIEKAHPEMRGIYTVINQQFCEHAWADVSYINREQDLGEEGLRAAKQSYHPTRMIEKFTVTLNQP